MEKKMHTHEHSVRECEIDVKKILTQLFSQKECVQILSQCGIHSEENGNDM